MAPKNQEIKKHQSSFTGTFGNDLFDNEILASYFDAKEHEVYYCSLSRVGPRRSAYSKIVDSFSRFLKTLSNPDAQEILNHLVFNVSSTNETNDLSKNVGAILKQADPDGFNLLDLPDDVTFEVLKKHYKRAAHRHHPDKGGSEINMKRVNVAYTHFHKLLSLKKLYESSPNKQFTVNQGARSSIDYYFWIAIILLEAHLDQFAIKESYDVYCDIKNFELLESCHWKDATFKLNHIETFSNLTIRLKAAALDLEAKDVFSLAESVFDFAKNLGLNYEYLRVHTHNIMNQKEKPLFGIKTLLQANNAFRFHIIDEIKYQKLVKKFKEIENKNHIVQDELSAFVQNNGFVVPLPSERQYFRSETPKTLIPAPAFNERRVNFLSKDQRNEYFFAFGRTGTVSLVEKYYHVRISGYLSSIIYNFSELDLRKLREEITVLCNLSREHLDDGEYLIKLIEFLASEPVRARSERLSILCKMDDPTAQGESGNLIITVSGDANLQANGGYLIEGRAIVHFHYPKTYFEIATLPLERLILFKNTGSDETEDEAAKNAEGWKKDSRILKKIEKSPIAKQAWDANVNQRRDPDHIIKSVEPHCEQLFRAGEMLEPRNTGELQLGYWISALSAAYVKISQWDKAAGLIEKFFSLDRQYFDRLSKGERAVLEKRLHRCKAQMSKER